MRTRFNAKRKLGALDSREREILAVAIRYRGNPEHKRNPGDFGLHPPALPRPDKSLCDSVGINERRKALELLQEGVRLGLVSEQRVGQFPQNIWSVTESGEPLEAQLGNRETGEYHGYPMPENDPFREVVLKAWKEARR